MNAMRGKPQLVPHIRRTQFDFEFFCVCVVQRNVSKGAEGISSSFSADKIKDPSLQRQRFHCESCYSHTGEESQEAVVFFANNDDQKLTVMLICVNCKAITEQKRTGSDN